MLYILSTPIGNLKDISLRAIETLKNVDLIIAEDTRRISNLLSKYEIKKRVTSYNDYTSEKKENKIISLIKEGNKIALVSDSGTPLISDPGYKILNNAIKNNIKISPIPGACAAITALSVSGCSVDKFTFIGFFPKKNNLKNKILKIILESDSTIIFYESPYRILKTLQLINELLPKRKICVAKELTKTFEEIYHGNVEYVVEKINNSVIKGEYTIVIDKKINK
jgi:16S rRNA (cytidine1402-2'-O)-methyltransferase